MEHAAKKLAYSEGVVSIAVNTVLFILKYWVGVVTGSITIIADAWHTLSDSLTSVIVIAGAKISSKPADTDHPFGHGRAESLASIIIGVLLLVVGINFFFEAIHKLSVKEGATFTRAAVIVFIVSVILKEAMARFSFWTYQKTQFNSLKADGWHHRSDAIASAVILLSIFFGRNLWWIDGVFGIIVSILIGFTAVDIIKDSAQPILGKKPNPEHIDAIKNIAGRYLFDLNDIHHIHEHSYGSHLEYTMHVYMAPDMPLAEAHEIINAFRENIRRELRMEVTIYMEPRNDHDGGQVAEYIRPIGRCHKGCIAWSRRGVGDAAGPAWEPAVPGGTRCPGSGPTR